jgi:hypothetical protein
MAMIRMFRQSSVMAQCDKCRLPFDPVHGGVCSQCRRLLCGAHIYGSILRRLQSFLGTALVCPDCRRGESPPPTG